MFVGPVSVDIAAEIDVSPVELLERLGHLHREADNLIGRQLFLQRSSWLGAVIDDPRRIAPVETIGWSMVTGIRVVKHGDDESTLQRAGAGDARHVAEVFILDCLEGAFRDLSPVLPACADGVRKIISRLRDSLSTFGCLGGNLPDAKGRGSE